MQEPVSKNMQLLAKAMPHSLNAEKALLSQIYGGSDALEGLSREDFYIEKHKIIFDIITDLREKKMCDDVAFIDELHKRQLYGKIDECDMLDLNIYTGDAGRSETFIKLVKDKAALRSIIKSSIQLMNIAQSGDDENIEYVLDQTEKLIHKLSSERLKSHFSSLMAIMQSTMREISSTEIKENGVIGLPTGFRKLDELTTGFQKSDLIIIGARPSMGKTALAVQFAINVAQLQIPVALFSLEMSSNSLAIRLLSASAGVNSFKIKQYIEEGKGDFIHLTKCAGELGELPIYIDDTGGMTINELRSRARKIVAEQGVRLIVIDYLQLILSVRKYENRVNEVADISRALKALAKELEIPIIALSQLSRKCEERADKRPMLSDIRESGAIEQDADLIMFLYRPVVYDPETEWPELTELIIGKQRNGPIDTVKLKFTKGTTSFSEWDNPEKDLRHWSERD